MASRIGGIPELVAHERNGLLFEAGSVEGLAHALERLEQLAGNQQFEPRTHHFRKRRQ